MLWNIHETSSCSHLQSFPHHPLSWRTKKHILSYYRETAKRMNSSVLKMSKNSKLQLSLWHWRLPPWIFSKHLHIANFTTSRVTQVFLIRLCRRSSYKCPWNSFCYRNESVLETTTKLPLLMVPNEKLPNPRQIIISKEGATLPLLRQIRLCKLKSGTNLRKVSV